MDEAISNDIVELDAEEFDIPKVELPTLESILNESDDEEDDLLLDLNNIQNGTSSLENSLLLSPAKQRLPELDALKNWETNSITSNDDKKRREKDKDKHGCVISIAEMEALTHQMVSAAERVNAGHPTALAVSSLIAVGTTKGLVLLFSEEQVMKFCLGSTQIGSKYGSVSALTFNADSTRLLAGYAKGEILMYDVTNGKLLRTITDAHPPGSAVLHVKFTDDPTLAVCNDSGGSVFELNFRRVMGVRSCESRCLFSGSRGEVCTIETLHLTKEIADHPLRDRHILAMGTLTKIIIVTLRPQIKILFSHKLTINSSCVPLIAWQLTVFHSNNQRSIDPVLMFARGDVVYFFQVKSESWDVVNFIHLRTMNLTYKLINLAWLNSHTILLLDMHERAHVVDVDSQEGLEAKSIGHIHMIYSSAVFKSIATGGNVSRALAVIGEHASYHSMVCYKSNVFFLGTNAVFSSTVLTWIDRIKAALVIDHKQALKLALTFFDGTAKAVTGLPTDQSERKIIVSETMLDILVEYVDLAMTRLCPTSGKLQVDEYVIARLIESLTLGRSQVLISFYRTVVPLCVDQCLHINRVDVLFGRIYDRFKADCIAHGAFLECLEPYILNDRLTVISPEVMHNFVEHFQAKNMLTNVEECLLHLDVASLDINQVMHLCWAHGLYDAIINVHNRGMKDYIGPLCELLLQLLSAMSSGLPLSDKMMSLGNKLLVYVSSCLAGVAYPRGVIDDESAASAKQQMFECLVNSSMKDHNLPGLYPVVTGLLKFSTKEFLNVLSLAFSEPDFQGQDGFSKIQNVIDVLLLVMLESDGFKPDQVGSLFTFLARQSARLESRLQLNPTLKQQVVDFLTTPSDHDTDHEERQQALVELLQCGVLDYKENSSKLTHLAERASFYRVLRFLYSKRRRFDLVFETHLKDPAQTGYIFDYVRDRLNSIENTKEEKERLKNAVLDNIKVLIKINSKEAALLVTSVLQGTVQTISAKLQDDPFVLFNFLEGFFQPTRSESQDPITDSYYSETADPPSQPTDPDTCELYLSLMCQFKRDRVLTYLQSTDVIRRHKALEITRRHRVDDATAFLLEESGDVSAAFNVLLNVSKVKMKAMSDVTEEDRLSSEEDMWASVDDVIRLCQRSSNKLLESQREQLWFPLLELVLKPQREATLDDDSFGKRLARHVLTSMIGHMTLPAVLQKIIQDPAFKSGKFGEIKNLLMGMLETYRYERTLLDTTLNLIGRDRHRLLTGLRKSITHSVTPRSHLCTFCRRSILLRATPSDSSKLVVFSHGTVYHERCLQADVSAGSNPRFDRDRKTYESNTRAPDRADGLLASYAAVQEEEDNYRTRTRTASTPNQFDPKDFSLKTRHPPIQL